MCLDWLDGRFDHFGCFVVLAFLWDGEKDGGLR
jgi:hypothetical protein